jgi:phage replication-related protein YjqB (UPF0714/DUF867 family)
MATATPDVYDSNTALYRDPGLVEGVDYARRYHRHELFDDGLHEKCGVPRTTIIAPHGGGIEFGTTELCLAIAGYHPATLAVTPGTGLTYDDLKRHLLGELGAVEVDAIDAVDHEKLNGDEATNIANRTLLGMGGHLELTGPLRSAMFDDDSRPRRAHTTTKVFWAFVVACRNALARLEASQEIL